MKVILSTTILVEEGTFVARKISLYEAIKWVKTHRPYNFCGHQTVKVLGIEPAKTRETCLEYSEALCLKPKGRIDPKREYSAEEILGIGVDIFLITKERR